MNHSFGSSRFEGERGKKKKRRGRERKLTKKQKKKEKKREFETRNIGRSCRVCQFRATKSHFFPSFFFFFLLRGPRVDETRCDERVKLAVSRCADRSGAELKVARETWKNCSKGGIDRETTNRKLAKKEMKGVKSRAKA